VKPVQEADPTLMIDGEMMADTAAVAGIVERTYPFSKLRGGANVLVFPDLTSANTCYKLLSWIGGAEKIGPILMGMSKPVHVPQRGCQVEEIVNLAAIAVVDAQETEVALDAELKAHKRQRMRGMRMRRVLRFNIANRERGKRNWERQLRAEGRGASLSWTETS
jgi:hypothetical protein